MHGLQTRATEWSALSPHDQKRDGHNLKGESEEKHWLELAFVAIEVGNEEDREDDDLEDAGEKFADGEVLIRLFVAAPKLAKDFGGEGFEFRCRSNRFSGFRQRNFGVEFGDRFSRGYLRIRRGGREGSCLFARSPTSLNDVHRFRKRAHDVIRLHLLLGVGSGRV